MIYGRFGNVVEIVRRGTIEDVANLDKRKADDADRKAIENHSYVVVRNVDGGDLTLYHLGYLRADGGSREITAAIEKCEGGFYFVAGFDEFDMPRAWGRAETLDAATDEATRQANIYIERKRELGETITLRLFECRTDESRRDLQTVITHKGRA